jgi:mitochondrial division protein 1
MTPHMISTAAASTTPRTRRALAPPPPSRLLTDLAALSRPATAAALHILEAAPALLAADVPEGAEHGVSLLRGFEATVPGAWAGRERRRKVRDVDVGGGRLLGAPDARGSAGTRGRRGRESLSALKVLGEEELVRQTREIERDKENVHVRMVGSAFLCLPGSLTLVP